MRWVRDTTGRFPLRPHYDWDEIDRKCEQLVRDYLQRTYGKVRYPIHTNDLTNFVETEAASLDLYDDFQEEGGGLHGLTDFFTNGKPEIRIARELTEEPTREKRLRTTLTHELGHAVFHQVLTRFRTTVRFERRVERERTHSFSCTRSTISEAHRGDWMEAQAGYASGAFLMPATVLLSIVNGVRDEFQDVTPFAVTDPAGRSLIRRTMYQFFVSEDAAQVRLRQLGTLSDPAI